MLPGKDFVRRRERERGFERLIDENEARTGSYEDFIVGLLLELRAARLKITLRLLFEGVVSGWSLVGEDFGWRGLGYVCVCICLYTRGMMGFNV